MTRRQQSIVTWMLIAGGIAGTGWLLYLTANLLWYYATGFIEADILIFLHVGRGVLNGLVPYVDLFESKPPGMFLLSALSLWISDGTALLTTIQILGWLFLPASAAWCAWDAARDASKAGRALCVLVALLGVDPPPCAEPFLPLPQFTTIFRKK